MSDLYVSRSSNITPHDKLCIAISILQNDVLAKDTLADAKATFGNFHMTTYGTEHAIHLLTDLLDEFEVTPS